MAYKDFNKPDPESAKIATESLKRRKAMDDSIKASDKRKKKRVNDAKAQAKYDKRPLLDPYRAKNELKYRAKQANKIRKRLFISND